jgi:hypothetical protein
MTTVARCIPSCKRHRGISLISLSFKPGECLSIFREDFAITSVAAEVFPIILICSYNLCSLFFIAATAYEKSSRREAIQGHISMRFIVLSNHESGGRCVGLNVLGMRDNGVFFATAGFRSHCSVTIDMKVCQLDISYR